MLLIVLKGTMRMEIDGEEYDIGPGEACDVRAFMMHRGYALGETPVSLVEVFSPVRHDYIHLVQWQEEDFGDHLGISWSEVAAEGQTEDDLESPATVCIDPRAKRAVLSHLPREVRFARESRAIRQAARRNGLAVRRRARRTTHRLNHRG